MACEPDGSRGVGSGQSDGAGADDAVGLERAGALEAPALPGALLGGSGALAGFPAAWPGPVAGFPGAVLGCAGAPTFCVGALQGGAPDGLTADDEPWLGLGLGGGLPDWHCAQSQVSICFAASLR